MIEHPRALGGIAAFDLVADDTSYSASAGRTFSSFAQEHGVLLRPLGNVLYLMPPYCITNKQIDRAFDVIEAFLSNAAPESQGVA